MGLLDRLTRTDDSTADSDNPSHNQEQLAADDPNPRGESREDDGGFLISRLMGPSPSRSSPDSTIVRTEKSEPPIGIAENWNKYYKNFSLTGVPLDLFADQVVEPGWTVTATVENDEGEEVEDEDMTDALRSWGKNCAVHACEVDQDLSVLLSQIVVSRRGKGTAMMEKAGTMENADVLRSLVLHAPETFKMYKREDKNILVQPDDDVDADHPTTPDGKAAAYVQYDDDLNFDDEDPIAFSTDDLVKFVYNADEGDGWGTSIYERINDRVDALIQKLEDRDKAIRMTGHPHRVFQMEGMPTEKAKEYARAHQKGEVSAWEGEAERDPDSFVGRVDFVGAKTEIKTADSDVADIADAVYDDVETIFAAMPIGKYKIAFADQINQFVVEPQQEQDAEDVDKERRYLERKFRPIFEEKADELASGDAYEGSISFSVEPSMDDNPLNRESFPAENLGAFADAWSKFVKNGIDSVVPAAVWAEMMGFDLEEFAEKHGWRPDELAFDDVDDPTDAVQQQVEEIEDEPLPGEADDEDPAQQQAES